MSQDLLVRGLDLLPHSLSNVSSLSAKKVPHLPSEGAEKRVRLEINAWKTLRAQVQIHSGGGKPLPASPPRPGRPRDRLGYHSALPLPGFHWGLPMVCAHGSWDSRLWGASPVSGRRCVTARVPRSADMAVHGQCPAVPEDPLRTALGGWLWAGGSPGRWPTSPGWSLVRGALSYLLLSFCSFYDKLLGDKRAGRC